MRIKSRSSARGGARIAPSALIIKEPVIDEVEGVEEVIEEEDEEEDLSPDGGVG